MERKLAAILAADVSGSGRMMERDEEGILDALRTYREVVEGLTAAHRRHAFDRTGEATNRVPKVLPKINERNEAVPACGSDSTTASVSRDCAGQ